MAPWCYRLLKSGSLALSDVCPVTIVLAASSTAEDVSWRQKWSQMFLSAAAVALGSTSLTLGLH